MKDDPIHTIFIWNIIFLYWRPCLLDWDWDQFNSCKLQKNRITSAYPRTHLARAKTVIPTPVWSPPFRKSVINTQGCNGPKQSSIRLLLWSICSRGPKPHHWLRPHKVRECFEKGVVSVRLCCAAVTPKLLHLSGVTQHHQVSREVWPGHFSWWLKSQPCPLPSCHSRKKEENRELCPLFSFPFSFPSFFFFPPSIPSYQGFIFLE